MTLAGYLRIFRQRWWLIVASMVLVAGVVFLLTPTDASDEPPASSYTATATLLASDMQASLGRIALYVTTGEVPEQAAQALGFDGDPAVLAQKVDVIPDPVAEAITISATDIDAAVAADRANAFADATVEYFERGREVSVTLLQSATPIPNMPTGGAVVPPSPLVRTGLGAAVGLLLGMALTILIDHLDGRLRTRQQIAKATGLPVVAEVPKLKPSQRREGSVMVAEEPLNGYSDAYRAARSAVLHVAAVPLDGSPRSQPTADVEGDGQILLITSAMAGEGKTTSAANIAASFAETGKRVLVVDADLRKPDIHQLFRVPQSIGVSDFLTDRDALAQHSLSRPTNVQGVQIVTAGTRLEHPASLTSRMEPVFAAARKAADIVVVDASPILMASDAFDMLPLVDSVLVVARSGRLTTESARRASELLGRFQVPVAGLIVIGGRDGGGSYGYGYGYGYGQKKRKRAVDVDAVPREAPVVSVDDAAASSGEPKEGTVRPRRGLPG